LYGSITWNNWDKETLELNAVPQPHSHFHESGSGEILRRAINKKGKGLYENGPSQLEKNGLTISLSGLTVEVQHPITHSHNASPASPTNQ
jgi:hypothetical protein